MPSNRDYFTCTVRTEEEWHRLRREGVGGSDVAKIMGFSKYGSPLEVWLEKTGRTEPADLSDNQAVEWGNRLEDVVARKFAEDHPEYIVRNRDGRGRWETLVSKTRPWAHANLDRNLYGVGEDGKRDGRRYLLEVKTCSAYRAEDWEDGVPDYYLTQVTHYLGVTGYEGAWVAVLIGGQEYREFYVERDEDDIRAVQEAVDAFWHDYVEADTPPALVGSDSEAAAVFGMHAEPGDEYEQALDEDVPELDELEQVRERIKELKARESELGTSIKARIGDLKGIETPTRKVTWSRSTSTTCDWRAFDKDHPHLMDSYIKTKPKDGGLRVTAKKGA